MAAATMFIISWEVLHNKVHPSILSVFASITALSSPSVTPSIFAFGIAIASSLPVFTSYPLAIASLSVIPTLDKGGFMNTLYGITFLSFTVLFPPL